MDILPYFRLQFQYNGWANLEAAKMLKTLDAPTDRMLKVLAHLVAAEVLWFERLTGAEQSLPVWPTLTVDEFLARSSEMADRYASFLSTISEEEYTRPIAYTNSKGQPWASRTEEILMHVLLHGSYHRGQLAMMVREAGGEPVLTDFIHAVRTGAVQSDS